MVQATLLAARAAVCVCDECREVIVRTYLFLLRRYLQNLPGVHPRFICQNRRAEVQPGQAAARQLVDLNRLGTTALRQGDDDTLRGTHNPPCDDTNFSRSLVPGNKKPSLTAFLEFIIVWRKIVAPPPSLPHHRSTSTDTPRHNHTNTTHRLTQHWRRWRDAIAVTALAALAPNRSRSGTFV